MKFRQSKGNNSAIAKVTPIKLHVHNSTIVLYIQRKFYEIPSIGYQVIAEDRKKTLKFRQSKGNSYATTNDIPIKLYKHNFIITIYIHHKFHECLSIGYLVMAEDGKSDGQCQTNIPPHLVVDNNGSRMFNLWALFR